jgi:3',5'-cyclic-AMP phosphodiesterase
VKPIIFLTDLHLEKMENAKRAAFIDSLAAKDTDTIILGGDIGLGLNTPIFLAEIATVCRHKKILFILGNHDFFGESFSRIKRTTPLICRNFDNLVFLDEGIIVPIPKKSACIIGTTGWVDARCGYKERSIAQCTDFAMIQEFKNQTRSESINLMRSVSDESTELLTPVLEEALKKYQHVILTTHFPTFHQAVRFDNKKVSSVTLPFFVNVSLGKGILDAAKRHRRKKITVLCGHTHSDFRGKVADNVEICVSAPNSPLLLKG